MPVGIEGYIESGVVTGETVASGQLRELLDSADAISLRHVVFSSLDGSPAEGAGSRSFPVDDLLVVVAAGLAPVAHAAWHRVQLVVGPYLVEGDLPTMPGFDPERSLLRPSGSFVLLENVQVRLAERPMGGCAEHHRALVNRYAVEALSADLMLGFFFPGARLVAPGEAVRAG